MKKMGANWSCIRFFILHYSLFIHLLVRSGLVADQALHCLEHDGWKQAPSSARAGFIAQAASAQAAPWSLDVPLSILRRRATADRRRSPQGVLTIPPRIRQSMPLQRCAAEGTARIRAKRYNEHCQVKQAWWTTANSTSSFHSCRSPMAGKPRI